MNFYLFTVTVPNIEEGKNIAQSLIENKLAACVNMIKDISSVYRWKGEIQRDNEHLLLIKTTEEKCELLIRKINEIHSYSVPECIGFKIDKGSEKYLNWVKDVVD
ncbi:MAG: divalent-cation tolerance protein CutA [Candidatus Lokiarchaeota archaeon]|nr:divalent-cation tolerance protein CutA [Candidatus Lokiarchaeota archaeon]